MCKLKDFASWSVASGRKKNKQWLVYAKIKFFTIALNDWVYTKALSLVSSFQ